MDEASYWIEILEDLEDYIAVKLRKNEECFDWEYVREELMTKE